MNYNEILTTAIGDNSLSSLQVPKGWEILAWQHDFYGETRLFQAKDTDMLCVDMDEYADNEASALTLRKLTEEPEPAPVSKPEPVPEPIIEVALPEFRTEFPALLFSEPDCSGTMWTVYSTWDDTPFNLMLADYGPFALGPPID